LNAPPDICRHFANEIGIRRLLPRCPTPIDEPRAHKGETKTPPCKYELVDPIPHKTVSEEDLAVAEGAAAMAFTGYTWKGENADRLQAIPTEKPELRLAKLYSITVHIRRQSIRAPSFSNANGSVRGKMADESAEETDFSLESPVLSVARERRVERVSRSGDKIPDTPPRRPQIFSSDGPSTERTERRADAVPRRVCSLSRTRQLK
jgi:hypothetical protein